MYVIKKLKKLNKDLILFNQINNNNMENYEKYTNKLGTRNIDKFII